MSKIGEAILPPTPIGRVFLNFRRDTAGNGPQACVRPNNKSLGPNRGPLCQLKRQMTGLRALLSNAFFSTLPEDSGCSSVSVGSSLVGQDTER